MTIVHRIQCNLTGAVNFMATLARTSDARIAYVGGWLGQRNLGDEAMFMAYKKLFPSYNFIRYKRRFHAFPIRILLSFSAGMLSGGTLIGRSDPSYYYDCINAFGQNYVFGTGVADPAFWSSTDDIERKLIAWKSVFERCDYVGVRGPFSARILQEIGMKNVDVIGDPILAFANDTWVGDNLFTEHSVGFNLGVAGGNLWGSEESVCNEFIKLARIAKDKSWIVKWFVVWPKDLDITLYAAKMSGASSEIYTIYDDPVMYLEKVSSVSTFVGLKLHAVALATCAYVPSVMIDYRPKCRDYMMSIGLKDATIRADIFSADHVWEILNNWDSKRSHISYSLFDSMRPIRKKQSAKAKEIQALLKSQS